MPVWVVFWVFLGVVRGFLARTGAGLVDDGTVGPNYHTISLLAVLILNFERLTK